MACMLKKLSFLLYLLFVTNTASICTDGKGWWPSIKTYFSSFQMPRSFPSFKNNQKWLGVGALAIASLSAWRYFRKPAQPTESQDLNQQLEDFGKTKVKWTEIIYRDRENKPKETSSDESNQKESLNDDDFDRLLDEADNEFNTERTLLTSLKIGDVVKIINDSSIDMATSDKKLYNNVQKSQGKGEIHDFKKILAGKLLNHIGIIRAKSLKDITVEIVQKKDSSSSSSAYLTILPIGVQKMHLLVNPFNQIKLLDLVKFSFDNQSDYIGTIVGIDPQKAKVNVNFHFRDYTTSQNRSLQLNTKDIFLIQNPEMLN
jgi:hypothetical protein